jgi:hypothetical protein
LCVAVWFLFVSVWLLPQRFHVDPLVIIRRKLTMASSAGNSPEPDDTHFSVPIIARLTVHVAGQGNKKKTTKKDIKTKEFSHTFSTTKFNYFDFLTTFLTKHHIGNKLQVTDSA